MINSGSNYPSYLSLLRSGELRSRYLYAYRKLKSCSLCPRACGADRLEGEVGECGGALPAKVASYNSHFGEEGPLVGYRGSGTIFFSYCPLHCIFCQNWDISQKGIGEEVSAQELAGMMISLQRLGCHNINLVTPTHFVPQILEAIYVACETGLNIPIVYNSGGYDAVETLKILEGVVDIYMPDFKYADEEKGKEYSKVPHYPDVAKAAIKEMHRQVGDLTIDDRGIAVTGLIIRHLVLPELLANTREVLRFIAEEISRDSYINIMDQYRPCYRAKAVKSLSQRTAKNEYLQAVGFAGELGLNRLDK